MKLIVKLNSVPLASSIIVLAILVISIVTSNSSSNRLSSVENGHFPSILLNKQAESNLSLIKKTLTDATLFGDEELIGKAEKAYEALINNLLDVKRIETNRPSLIDSMSSLADAYFQMAVPLTKDMVAEKEMDDAFFAKSTKMNDYYNNLEQMITNQYAELNRTAAESFSASKALINRIVKLLLVLAGFSLVSFITGFIFSKKVIDVINRIVRRLKDIAEGEGDLTKRIDITSKDETGQLAKWFNIFVEKIQEIIKSINTEAGTLSNSTVELNHVSENMKQVIHDMAAKNQNTARSADEVTNNVTAVSSAVEESNSNLSTVSSAAEEMNATINEIAKNTENAKIATQGVIEKVGTSVQKVTDFGKRAADIVKIIDTINDISDQTNLLALNATIEAASAGDAGKGFAVVAAEVKELAKQSVDAAKDISKMINNIISSVGATVNDITDINGSMSEINNVVTTIASAIEEQSITTAEIVSNITQTSSGLNEVACNISNANMAVASVAEDTNVCLSSSKEVENGSEVVNDSVSQLTEMAERLNQLVGKFTV